MITSIIIEGSLYYIALINVCLLMVIGLTYSKECSFYPGGYVPLPETEELLENKKELITRPAINMDEFDNFFKIEVSLPGTHKEDIVILVEDNIVTVKVVHKEQTGTASTPRIHEFDINYFERQIALPEDADAEFTSAEFRDGILNLIVPKVAEHSQAYPNRIVVY